MHHNRVYLRRLVGLLAFACLSAVGIILFDGYSTLAITPVSSDSLDGPRNPRPLSIGRTITGTKYISDTHIVTATNRNYGTATELLIDSASANRPLYYIDVNSVITGRAVIERADLILTIKPAGSDRSLDVCAYEVLTDWLATEATWCWATKSSRWNMPGCESITYPMDRAENPVNRQQFHTEALQGDVWKVSFDLKELVQSWVREPSRNRGIILLGKANWSSTWKIASNQHGIRGREPSMWLKWIPCHGLTASFTATEACYCSSTVFSDTSTAVPPGEITAWSWDFDGDEQEDSAEENPTYHFPLPGVYTVTLTVTDSIGCWNYCSIPVTVHDTPSCSISCEDEVCDGGSVPLEAEVSGGKEQYTYRWSDTCDGSFDDDESPTPIWTPPDVDEDTPCTIKLVVTDANDCVVICSTIVAVHDTPSCSISGADQMCVEGRLSLTATVIGGTRDYEYVWSDTCGGAFDDDESGTPAWTPPDGYKDRACTLQLVVTDANGCTTICRKAVKTCLYLPLIMKRPTPYTDPTPVPTLTPTPTVTPHATPTNWVVDPGFETPTSDSWKWDDGAERSQLWNCSGKYGALLINETAAPRSQGAVYQDIPMITTVSSGTFAFWSMLEYRGLTSPPIPGTDWKAEASVSWLSRPGATPTLILTITEEDAVWGDGSPLCVRVPEVPYELDPDAWPQGWGYLRVRFWMWSSLPSKIRIAIDDVELSLCESNSP